MISCIVYIIRYQILKRQHALHIQVSRTGNKILRIGILAGKLIANKMTAII